MAKINPDDIYNISALFIRYYSLKDLNFTWIETCGNRTIAIDLIQSARFILLND